MNKEDFIKAGFTVVSEEIKDNKLIAFLKEHYPSVIKDNEINLQELKAVAGLPVDEKVNGYGLNFVGRNFARAKYAQKTDKELRLNKEMSKNIDTTQNLVLKGDNLDCLKILKNYYSGKIKCIYIDPPYNTDKDEFVYPDKFDKEEAEVLGLVNLSEDDFARMEFSFKTKKSHNGWLAFMYPRLLLARDLLSNDGVIFISIDDNEVANLKLLCDEVFGEENCLGLLTIINNLKGRSDDAFFATANEYCLCYSKNKKECSINGFELEDEEFENDYNLKDEIGYYKLIGLRKTGKGWEREERPFMYYPILKKENNFYAIAYEEYKKIYNVDKNTFDDEYVRNLEEKYKKQGYEFFLPLDENGNKGRWRWGYETFIREKDINVEINSNGKVCSKMRANLEDGSIRLKSAKTIWYKPEYDTGSSGIYLKNLFYSSKDIFDNPKSFIFLKDIVKISSYKDSIILDFFAGSGTTGHAVMQLNAEDGGNRKFILCQIDEPIKEDKPAYKFCIDNNLQPVISSITIERLRRAGEKIKQEIEEANSKNDVFEEGKKQFPDIGFKVFDSVDAPKLKVDDAGQIQFPELNNDTLSRIYNMIFTVGLDEPTQVPEELVKDCIYKIGNHYYITNSEKITSDDFANAIKNGKVFVDGWTASLNATLQHYKEDVKIVF